MANLEETINQAISDFNDIEKAIEEKGVDVPYDTDTSEYGGLIRSIPQTQIGGESPIKVITSPDLNENKLDIFSMESGTYILEGKFIPYPGSTSTLTFSSGQLVAVRNGTASTVIQVFYPPNNTIQYLNIWEDEESETGFSYERKDAKLNYMEDVRNKTNIIDFDVSDESYPTTKAVFYFGGNIEKSALSYTDNAVANASQVVSNSFKATASGEVIRVDDVSPLEHTAMAKVKGKNRAKFTDSIEMSVGMTTYSIECDAKAPFVVSYNVTAESVKNTSSAFLNIVYTDGTNTYDAFESGVGTHTKYVKINNGKQIEEIRIVNWNQAVGTLNWLQVEEGDTATEYEPYINPSLVTVTRCGKNLFDTTKYLTRTSTVNGVTVDILDDGCIHVHGTPTDSTNATSIAMTHYQEVDVFPKGTYIYSNNASVNNSDVLCFPQANKPENGAWIINLLDEGTDIPERFCMNRFVVYIKAGATAAINITYYLQVEAGTEATEYEVYKKVSTHTPDADGNVEIPSLSPTMKLLTDTEGVNIELEYNQDSNAFKDNVNADLKELDRVTAELAGKIGDVDTLLNEVHSYAQDVINGGES